jgi:hypothetical protein
VNTGEAYSVRVRSRNALLMTDTDDKLIASAASMGDSSSPVAG